MTMAEKKLESVKKEIEKLTNSLDRLNGLLEKKIAKCAKLNCVWDGEEMREHRDNGTMSNDQWDAWFDMEIKQSEIKDTEHRLSNAFNRLENAEKECAKVAGEKALAEAIDEKELKWLEATQAREEKFYEWLANFKAECLMDGIIIENASKFEIYGTTKNGKRFVMYINEGWTDRSRHSYTLRINGNTYFTSGLFSTGYRYLLNY